MKKIFAILMAVSVLGVIIAGCGKKEDEAATTGTTGAAATTGETTTGK